MIRGWFDEMGRPLVLVGVDIPRLNFRKRISLLIDTGADRTSLHPGDCDGMPYTLLGNVSEY